MPLMFGTKNQKKVIFTCVCGDNSQGLDVFAHEDKIYLHFLPFYSTTFLGKLKLRLENLWHTVVCGHLRATVRLNNEDAFTLHKELGTALESLDINS